MSVAEFIIGGPTYALTKMLVEKLSVLSVDVPDNADLVAVRAETERQENEMRRLELQAKVAQEMAIASRIENATEVEIEEYYEYFGEGKAGLNASESSVSIGVSGSAKRVTKRIVRFTGHQSSLEA